MKTSARLIGNSWKKEIGSLCKKIFRTHYLNTQTSLQKQTMDTVGRNKKVIAEYIRNQLEEDYTLDQMSIKEYTDPFTGSKNSKA